MFRFLRTADPVRTINAHNNPIYYEDGGVTLEFHDSSAEYAMTHTISSKKSIFQPPLHFHVEQTEDFLVHKGEATFYMPRNPNPALRVVPVSGSTVDAEARKVHIPVHEYHRFENALDDVPLMMSVRLDERDMAQEESFFRNFFGYLDDCRMSGKKPSVFQIMLLLYRLGAPPALLIPGPRWIGVAASRAFVAFMGVFVGKILLGYKSSYVEYYNPKGGK